MLSIIVPQTQQRGGMNTRTEKGKDKQIEFTKNVTTNESDRGPKGHEICIRNNLSISIEHLEPSPAGINCVSYV